MSPSKVGIKARHKAILSLIQQYAIEDQEAISRLLEKHFKIQVNQAIISRDLRALGVHKVFKAGKSVYEIPNKDVAFDILNLGIKAIEHNDYLVVIKTLPGLADFVADFLDKLEEKTILGTISGENTIFVTPVTGVAMKAFHRIICDSTRFKIEG